MIILVARYVTQTGKGDAVAAALAKMQPLVQQHEPGCLLYQACRATDNPDQFLIYEQYANQHAVDAHRQTEHFERFVVQTIIPLLAQREVTSYTLLAG